MKQTQFDKHTIAWFKIAECVSRGEKERAFGVYRLLSHSFNDNAIARQLEADIHFSFGDYDVAIPLYIQAMELYQTSDRFLEAAAVCEHLIALNPYDFVLRRQAIKLYSLLHNTQKMEHHIEKALDIVLATAQDHAVQEFLSFLRGYGQALYDYALIYMSK